MNFQSIRTALSDGLLSFPITDMDEKGNFNPEGYQSRIKWFLTKDISTIFVAGGTGEFFSLSKKEYAQIVNIAVQTTNGQVPVISSVGRSIPEAIEFAKIAESAGVDGLLLMPPYLTECPKDGTVAYAKAIMQNTNLPVIYYNRSNGILATPHLQELAESCPNLIGLKDGTSNMQDLNDIIKTIGNRLVYIGGAPTAEIISEAYLSIGVNTYSSAVFNFIPDVAIQFYQALRAGNKDFTQKLLQEFYIPFVRLRGKKRGYAVSLIKEGTKLIGKSAGNVRSPLVMPNPNESKVLAQLIEKAEQLRHEII